MADQQDINNQKEFNEELSITDKLLLEIQKNSNGIKDSFTDLTKSFNDILDDLTNQNETVKGITQSFKGLKSIASQLRDEELGILNLNIEQLQKSQERGSQIISNLEKQQKALKEIISEQDESDKNYEKNILKLKTVNQELKSQESSLNTFNKLLDDRIKKEERIVETLGVAGSITDGLEKTLKGIGFSNLANRLGLDEARATKIKL